MSTYEHRRAGGAANPFPTLAPGELAVNTYNRQIAAGDVVTATLGNPLPMLAVRYFSTAAQYAIGDMVIQANAIWFANAAITPGPFTAGQWTKIADNLANYVSASGGAMSGPLLLPGNPTTALAAAPKQYVDAQIAAIPASPPASGALPLVNGTAAPGTANAWSRGDHIHPTDATRAALAGAQFTGAVTGVTPSPGDNSTNMATTAFVAAAVPVASSANPAMNGAAAPGTGAAFARADHIHPSDTSRLAKAGDTMTGDLTLMMAWPTIFLSKPASGTASQIYGQTNGVNRWAVAAGDASAEGGNAGSNFVIARYNDAGTYLDGPLTIMRSSGAVAIKGTSANDAAAAGNVGEWIEASVAWGSAVALVNNATSNATSIALSAGDWDVSGMLGLTGTATTLNSLYLSISQASAALSTNPPSMVSVTSWPINYNNVLGAGNVTSRVGPARLSLAVTTTVYLCVQASFGGGTCNIIGANINARRVR